MASIKPGKETSQDFAADLASLRDDVAKLNSSLSEFIRTHSATSTNTVFEVADNAPQKISDTANKAHDPVAGATTDVETHGGGAYRDGCRHARGIAKSRAQMNVLINRLLNEATAPIEKMGTGLQLMAKTLARPL